MGLCRTFGLPYLLEEVKDDIRPNDTIIIIPEYDLLQREINGNLDIIHVVEAYPRAALYILRCCLNSPNYSLHLLHTMLTFPSPKWQAFFGSLKKMWEKGHYYRKAFDKDPIPVRYYFNKQGDHFFHYYARLPNLPYQPAFGILREASDEATNLLNNFNSFARNHRARVFLIPCSVPITYLMDDACSKSTIDHWPGNKIDISVLSNPRHYGLPKGDFYEVPYHLNGEGRNRRTALIIEDLKPYFSITQQNKERMDTMRHFKAVLQT